MTDEEELRVRVTERRIGTGFALTVLGAAAFGTTFALGGQTQVEGISLAVAFLGLSYGFAAWVRILPPGPYVEEREPMAPTPAQRAAAVRELDEDDRPLARTPFPRRMLMLALGSLGVVALFPLKALLGRGPRPSTALTHTAWARGVAVVDVNDVRVRPEDVAGGGLLTVFPEGHTKDGDVATVLLRVDPQQLRLPPDRMAWTVDGLVAFSKICTHAGCPVGLYADELHKLLCPCHQSTFDVLSGAKPVFGPATRPLPQLPLAVDASGFLVAMGGFPDAVGADFWRKR